MLLEKGTPDVIYVPLRTFAAGNKIKQFYELLVEDSLRREDVEKMSRENMKNLHEIMQVSVRQLGETCISVKWLFFSRSGSVMFVSGAICPELFLKYSYQSDSFLFIGAGGCQISREISTVMSMD